MGLLDKVTGKDKHHDTKTGHHSETTGTAGTTAGTAGTAGNYSAYEQPNAGGAVYGSGVPGQQQPYATHNTTHTDHHHHEKSGGHGLLHKKQHEREGNSAYTQTGATPVSHGAPTGGIGSTHNTHTTQQDTYAQPGVYHNNPNTATGVAGEEKHHNSSGGGLFGNKKKDSIEDSIEEERRAKAELDAAMARHQAARTDAQGKLQAREDAARAELEAAQRKLDEAQASRTQYGY